MRLIVIVPPPAVVLPAYTGYTIDSRSLQALWHVCKSDNDIGEEDMDLGIHGRTAIVCASSQGLGKACARALAEAGVSLVINGRNRTLLDQTAEEIRQATGAEVTPVVADVSTQEGQEALLAACAAPDILINNNGGPPFRDFRVLDRQAMLTGVTMNMVTP